MREKGVDHEIPLAVWLAVESNRTGHITTTYFQFEKCPVILGATSMI